MDTVELVSLLACTFSASGTAGFVVGRILGREQGLEQYRAKDQIRRDIVTKEYYTRVQHEHIPHGRPDHWCTESCYERRGYP